MKNLALLILTGFFPLISLAQGSVKGKLVDTARQSLTNATVSVLQQKDSSLVSYSLSDTKGSFEIKNLSVGDYHLFVSFTGYEGYKNSFSITATQRVVDLGVIILQHEYKTVKSEVMFRSKQSELAKAVEPLGLKELVESPIVLNPQTP